MRITMSDRLPLTTIQALADDPMDGSGVIGLSEYLDAETLAGSIVATRAHIMLAHAHDNDGIGLTASGALNRKFLAWAVEAFDWPGYKPAEVYAVNKVVNEIDYLPGWYLHEVMKRRKCLRKYKDRLILSPAGRKALDKPSLLQAELFLETFVGRYLPSLDTAFLGDFDLYFGLLLWQVRQATQTWASARDIFEVAVIPDDMIHELDGQYSDAPIHGFHLRVLRLLCWFGLLESTAVSMPVLVTDACHYRATSLFDRFVHFHFSTSDGADTLH